MRMLQRWSVVVLAGLGLSGPVRSEDVKAQAQAAWAWAQAQHAHRMKQQQQAGGRGARDGAPESRPSVPPGPVIYYEPSPGYSSPAYYQPYYRGGTFYGGAVCGPGG